MCTYIQETLLLSKFYRAEQSEFEGCSFSDFGDLALDLARDYYSADDDSDDDITMDAYGKDVLNDDLLLMKKTVFIPLHHTVFDTVQCEKIN